jgi:hypothetical protein
MVASIENNEDLYLVTLETYCLSRVLFLTKDIVSLLIGNTSVYS